jgi:hypothetical protein
MLLTCPFPGLPGGNRWAARSIRTERSRCRLKIKNRSYTQMEGQGDLLIRRAAAVLVER